MPSDRTIQALRAIEHHAIEGGFLLERMTREQFRVDRRTFHAVTRCLEIISEATRRLPEQLKTRHPLFGLDLVRRSIVAKTNVLSSPARGIRWTSVIG